MYLLLLVCLLLLVGAVFLGLAYKNTNKSSRSNFDLLNSTGFDDDRCNKYPDTCGCGGVSKENCPCGEKLPPCDEGLECDVERNSCMPTNVKNCDANYPEYSSQWENCQSTDCDPFLKNMEQWDRCISDCDNYEKLSSGWLSCITGEEQYSTNNAHWQCNTFDC